MKTSWEDSIISALKAYVSEYPSVRAAADSLGITYETFKSWHDGKKSPTIKSLSPVAARLGLCGFAPSGVVRRVEPNAPEEVATGAESVAIPIYTLAGAGPALELEERDPITTIYVARDYAMHCDSALLIKGDSMQGTIPNGGVVGVLRHDFEFVAGEIYAVRLPYEGVSIKRILIDYERDEYIIRSDNPDREKYPDRRLSISEHDDIILGRVVWIWRAV